MRTYMSKVVMKRQVSASVTVETALVMGIVFLVFFALVSVSVDAAVKIKEAGILQIEEGKEFFDTCQASEWMRKLYAVSSGLTHN